MSFFNKKVISTRSETSINKTCLHEKWQNAFLTGYPIKNSSIINKEITDSIKLSKRLQNMRNAMIEIRFTNNLK
jgi:hypothetical protein